eukprot:3503259-Rhodomonas_salina.1
MAPQHSGWVRSGCFVPREVSAFLTISVGYPRRPQATVVLLMMCSKRRPRGSALSPHFPTVPGPPVFTAV